MVRMVRQPAKGKGLIQTSVKLLDAASGTMDRWRLRTMIKIIWREKFYIVYPQCWSAVGNGPCGSGSGGSGGQTNPPSSPSPTTAPTGTLSFDR